MKIRHILAATAVAATLATSVATPAMAQVGVSVSIGQPGFYGRLDIGGFPAPALLYPQPVMIRPVPPGIEPLYLRVPPGHAKDWRRYCGRYDACGRPVYFVKDSWYQREYVPRYQERHGGYREGYREGYRDGDRYDDRRDDRRDNWGGPGDRGRGRDHDHGGGHGHGRGRD